MRRAIEQSLWSMVCASMGWIGRGAAGTEAWVTAWGRVERLRSALKSDLRAFIGDGERSYEELSAFVRAWLPETLPWEAS